MSRQFGAGHLMYTLTGVAIVGVTAVAGVTAFTNTASTKADFSVGISPSTASVQQGATTAYGVNLTAGTGWSSSTPISVSTSSLPKGASACVVVGTAACVATASTTTASTSSITVRVTAGASTPAGSSTISVDTDGSNQKHSATATLVVNAAAQFSLSVSPFTATVEQGATVSLTVTLTRATGFNGAVTLSSPDLPKGVSPGFAPSAPTGTTSQLTLTATASANVGTAPFTVVGVAAGQPTQYAGAQVSVVGPTKRSFAISGTATGLLMPGASTPIDLSIDNTSNNQNLLVDNLSVSVSGVTRASGVTAACTPSDFAVVQYSGGYPLTVPAGSTRTLSALSVPVANRPQLQMLDTSSNQDGCKNASLTLSYNGTGHGG